MKLFYPIIVSTFLLTSCVTQNSPTVANTEAPMATIQTSENSTIIKTEPQTIKEKSKTSSKPSSWELSGAMAIRAKSKASSVSINWLQQGVGSYQIRLYGPLGSGTILISKQGNTITLRDGAKSSSSNNAEALLATQTGINLPVSNLYYWVRGLPAPGGVSKEQRDASGHLSLLEQDGFSINYLSYTQAGNISLPSQIRLQGPNLMIKLVIKKWKV